MGARAASEAAIARAIRAAQACGLTVAAFSVDRDGRVTVETVAVAPDADPAQDTRKPIPWT